VEKLFEAAKAADEFEYACALLNIEGMKDNGWSPEVESWTLINEVASYMQLPTVTHAKIRLGLLQYSHIAEMEITYGLVANMLRVVSGMRYSFAPFMDKNGHRIEKPTEKLQRIGAMARKVGLDDVSDLFDWYEPRIRNSFSHSNYQLHENRYNIARDSGIVAEGVVVRGLSIEREIVSRMNGALRFFATRSLRPKRSANLALPNITILGGHSKAASRGHLKTGQRSVAT
jgi:hypothetical protein